MRDVKKKSTHLCTFFRPSYVQKDPIDKRERSEFPQQQTYQRYVRVVVVGVLGRELSFGHKDTALSLVPSPFRRGVWLQRPPSHEVYRPGEVADGESECG